jgi:chromosomal replication initiator protein
MAILKKNAENFGGQVGDDILEYIANNIKSNIRELEGAFNKIIAY